MRTGRFVIMDGLYSNVRRDQWAVQWIYVFMQITVMTGSVNIGYATSWQWIDNDNDNDNEFISNLQHI